MAARTPAPKARWLLPVVLVVMIVTAAGAVVARTIYTAPVEANATRPLAVPGATVPAEQPGDATVKATEDAAAHPLYDSVRQLLQANFDAINTQNYGLWQSVVSDTRAKSQPKDAWLKAYRSTADGSIVVQRIEAGPMDTARVMLSFTSVQDPADAPTELPEPCIHWQVVFPLGVENGTWKLKAGTTAQAPQLQKC